MTSATAAASTGRPIEPIQASHLDGEPRYALLERRAQVDVKASVVVRAAAGLVDPDDDARSRGVDVSTITPTAAR